MKRTRIAIVALMSLATTLLNPSPRDAQGACYKQQIVTINVGTCPACHGYPTPVCDPPAPNVSGAYGVCNEACPGESGKVNCIDNGTVTMTTYTCDRNWDVSNIVGCSAVTPVCVVACAICVIDLTKLSCVGCAGCLIGAGALCAGCELVDSCDRIVTGTYQQAHKSVSGASCTG